jgi:hypothetical protein
VPSEDPPFLSPILAIEKAAAILGLSARNQKSRIFRKSQKQSANATDQAGSEQVYCLPLLVGDW